MMKVTVEIVGDGGRRTVGTMRIGPGPDGTLAVAAMDAGDPVAGIAPGTAGCVVPVGDGHLDVWRMLSRASAAIAVADRVEF